MRYLAIVGLLALLAVPALADPESISADVSITVERYASLTWDNGSAAAFSITFTGDTSKTETAMEPFTAEANFKYDLTASLQGGDYTPTADLSLTTQIDGGAVGTPGELLNVAPGTKTSCNCKLHATYDMSNGIGGHTFTDNMVLTLSASS